MNERGPQDDFVPIAPNPYIVGTPVRDPSMFFGREAEFDLVRRRFQGSTEGGLLVFCGERRSGKTSILFQIVQGRLGQDFIPVLVDMQSMVIGGQVEFLAKISVEVVQALARRGDTIEVPDLRQAENPSARFLTFIADAVRRHPDQRLLLLFDEYELFENKIDAGVLTEDVLNILSNLMEHHSVLLIFTGSQHVEQRRREYWKILGKSLYRHISFLQLEDAQKLIEQPVAGRVEYEAGVVGAIYRLSAGYPFYTQAICQNVVDQLNERRSNRVTHEVVAHVADGIAVSPLPQMMFLWDVLQRDEKIVLALLAETLMSESRFATARSLVTAISNAEYPLELNEPWIASVCDRLHEKELLLKNPGTVPAYAFRVDLLRLWIRRMHSVWSVLRDQGMEIAPSVAGPSSRRRVLAIVGLMLALVVVFALGRFGLGKGWGARSGGAAVLLLEAEPRDARIDADGNTLGIGSLRAKLSDFENHSFLVRAPGYHDSLVVANAREGDTVRRHVALTALLGRVWVQTIPPGAVLTVDGRAGGTTPTMVERVPVPGTHYLQASLAGFVPTVTPFQVTAESLLVVNMVLSRRSKDLDVTTSPAGATILLDGVPRGASPLRLRGVPFGRHSLAARMEGYRTLEATMLVGETTGEEHLILTREAGTVAP